MKTVFTRNLLILLVIFAASHRSSAQSLLGTSWKANSAFTSAYSSIALYGVIDSVILRFKFGNVWEMVFYQPGGDSIVSEKGIWSQIDASHFSIDDTLSTSSFTLRHACSASDIDTDTYSIIHDTLMISGGSGGCSIREAMMAGNWYGPASASSSVNDPLQRHTLQVYPNPVGNFLYIQGGSAQLQVAPVNITLYDITGRVVRQEIRFFVGATIIIEGLHSLPAGIYNLATEQNGVKEHFKIVKQ